MKLLKKWIPRLLMVSSYFWAIGYLIWKYTETTVLEETTTTLPIPILIVIVLLVSIVTFGGFVILLLSWWEEIKKDKLSFRTFAPISILMLGVIVLSKLLMNKVRILIEINSERFISDMSTYSHSMTVLLIILGVGTFIGALGFVFEERV